MPQMNIPDEAVRYILFQRTAYLRFTRSIFYRRIPGSVQAAVYGPAVALEAWVRRDAIKAEYSNDLRGEYESIRNFLPARCSAILDIGCGVAGIDVFLADTYRPERPRIVLLDRTRTETEVFYGFKNKGAFYNSLEVARSLLMANGLPEGSVELVEATDNNDINVSGKVDLVISLISWGFHYPVETYLHKSHQILTDNGRLIIDVRKGTAGIEALRSVFARVDVIIDTSKYQRVLAYKGST